MFKTQKTGNPVSVVGRSGQVFPELTIRVVKVSGRNNGKILLDVQWVGVPKRNPLDREVVRHIVRDVARKELLLRDTECSLGDRCGGLEPTVALMIDANEIDTSAQNNLPSILSKELHFHSLVSRLGE